MQHNILIHLWEKQSALHSVLTIYVVTHTFFVKPEGLPIMEYNVTL